MISIHGSASSCNTFPLKIIIQISTQRYDFLSFYFVLLNDCFENKRDSNTSGSKHLLQIQGTVTQSYRCETQFF